MKMHLRRKTWLGDPRIIDYTLCGFWAAFNSWKRAYITDDGSKVTCKTCRKIMRKKKA